MNIFDIEGEYFEITRKIRECLSVRQKTLLLQQLFNYILTSENRNICEAYLTLHLDEFAEYLRDFDVVGINPVITEDVILTAELLCNSRYFSNYSEKLKEAVTVLREKNKSILRVLNGKESNLSYEGKTVFPLLEDVRTKAGNSFRGYLESVTVKIEKAAEKSSFIIIPSGFIVEKSMKRQVELSWDNALRIASNYKIKTAGAHEVIVRFDKRLGDYTGNSFGVSLTVAMLEQLLKFYRSNTAITLKDNIALTGGIDEEGAIKNISASIISSKVECIFFSSVNIFAVPRADEFVAANKLSELKKLYPERQLKIVGIQDISDLLDRRNIVEIKKQNIVKRTGYTIRKHKLVFVLASVIVMLLLSPYAINIEDNPNYATGDHNSLLVKNRFGKILWGKHFRSPVLDYQIGNKNYSIVFDVDSDGHNEVLTSLSIDSSGQDKSIKCFNYDGTLKWEYSFHDVIETMDEKFRADYDCILIGLNYENHKQVLYAIARHRIFYPSAIFKLDAANGKRLEGIFWHAGHVQQGLLSDFNKDNKKEIVAAAINNSYECSCIFSINLDKLNGQGPHKLHYHFLKMPLAQFNSYMLLPKSDLSIFYRQRYNVLKPAQFTYDKSCDKFFIPIQEGKSNMSGVFIIYTCSSDLTYFNADCSDEMRVMRDSLVNEGMLSLPYTSTRQYEEYIEKQIDRWNGEQFVRAETGRINPKIKP